MIDRTVEQFSISAHLLNDSPSLRLDASFYNLAAVRAVAAVEQSGMDARPLGAVVERLFIPPRFRRIYVDRDHGVPFLQGGHIVQMDPPDLKYLSRTAHKNLERWIIESGWILVTCSGTVGRVALAPRQWDGWAASQHILRIVPRDEPDCPRGYLAAFLSSPLGRAQLTAQVYGAVVDELSEEQARRVLVPVARTAEQRSMVHGIHEQMIRSSALRTDAVEAAWAAARMLADALPLDEVDADALPMVAEDPAVYA